MADLVITNFHKGLSSSPYLSDGAYSKAENIDIDYQQGIIQAGQKMDNKQTTTDSVNWIIFSPFDSKFYAVTSGQKIYRQTGPSTWTDITDVNQSSGNGQGLGVWKDYLFVAGTNKLDCYGPLSGTPSWTIGFKDLATDSAFHPIFSSKNDGELYIGNRGSIANLYENAGQTFNPATTATYTWNSNALSLPPKYKIRCLEEDRENILIGTWKGANIFNVKEATIFIWDRERTEYDYPVSVPECGIQAMKNVGGLVYVIAGLRGQLYLFSEARLIPVKRIPITVPLGGWFQVFPGAIISFKEKLLIGTVHTLGAVEISPMGIWSFKDKRFNHERLVSSGVNGFGQSAGYYSLCASESKLLGGWRGDNNYGIDAQNNNSKLNSYRSFFESIFYRVGTKERPRVFKAGEIQLVEPLVSGSGIKLKYRTAMNASWKTIGTFDYATYKAVQSFIFPISIVCENIQIRCEFDVATNTSPKLLEIRLK